MPKNRLLVISLSIILAGIVTVLLAPFTVSRGLRLWIWWEARRQGLNVEVGEIDAPFLRPVILHRLRIASPRDAVWRAELNIAYALVELNLTTILTGARGRDIRSLSIEGLRAEIHHTASEKAKAHLDWTTLQRLLPSRFKVTGFDFRVENDVSLVLLRNASFSGSEIEAGHFDAREFTIASPWFRQTFSNLRGATKWQDDRLTLGGIALTRGLDLQSMAADLSHLGKQQAELQFDLDAFGGKIRASVSNEWRLGHANWNIAGAANDISLAQTSEAIGFTDRLGGSLHACKFTFRGDPHNVRRATASIWTELAGLSWRNCTAEVIMVGAVLYNRQIQLQQFYVKQHENQFTLSGEGSLPSKPSDWLSPDFRGDISGAISDLGDFASLFGAEPGDFGGKIVINGTMDARNRKIGGHLSASGSSLSIFKANVDHFTAKLNLKGNELEVDQLDIDRKQDFVRAQGKIDMSHEHKYSGTIKATVGDATEYLSILLGRSDAYAKPVAAKINATITSDSWDAQAIVNLPGSSPLNLATRFTLKLGQDWKAFLAVPLNVTIDFPAIFLASTPQFLHPEIFNDGILSGKITLSETLQHPRVIGDLQLLNAKLANALFDLTQASAHLTFTGEHAVIDFFNAATRDVDLSFRGEIDFHDLNDLVVKAFASVPIFDLTNGPLDCAGQIKLEPAGMTLPPMIEELDFRGEFFSRDWTVNLTEQPTEAQAADVLPLRTTRAVRLCFGTGEKSLTLGLHPRPRPQTARQRKRAGHH